ncbi:helix-turn-helix domain-containing protein [Pandoraea sp. NPDC087047]|uniref:helix-turn-helix domain-containing protein n=1 Tax=Pandoraea sp. NPDC087047 TaxID=3364390 RepID=UPI003828FA2B
MATFELMRYLDCYDPRPRIHELRHNHDYEIRTVVRAERRESGAMHRVGVYVLQAQSGETFLRRDSLFQQSSAIHSRRFAYQYKIKYGKGDL